MASSISTHPVDKENLKIGCQVEVALSTKGVKGSKEAARGIVKYFGTTKFKSGQWVGIELDSKFIDKGKNDGSVQGVRYFECSSSSLKQTGGIFVRPDNVRIILDEIASGHDDDSVGTAGVEELEISPYTSLFNMQTQSFIYDKAGKSWIPYGSGETLFRWVSKVGKFWLTFSNDLNDLDHYVDPNTIVEERKVMQNQSWVFRATPRVASGVQVKQEVLCLQFLTVHEAKAFVSRFEECRKSMLIVAMTSSKGAENHAQNGIRKPKKKKDKIKALRRRLTVSGNDPLLDGHRKGASRENESQKSRSRTRDNTESSRLSSKSISAYSGVSCKGIAPYNPDKPNQDSLIMDAIVNETSSCDDILFCVFDGHGENGHNVSQHFQSRLPSLLRYAKGFDREGRVGTILKEALLLVEREIINDCSIDTTLSGTTAVVSLLRKNKLFVANVGDSRIIKGTLRDRKIVAEDVSIDHKPDLEAEQKRIESCGGRVFAMQYDDGIDGPPRVWLSYADMPGLAMSRSLCDTVAKEAGVTSEAEIFEYTLDSKDKFLVLATDGLWEFMSSQEVADIVAKYMSPADPKAAIRALVQESNKRWRAEEPVIDDTTIIVVYLK